MSIKSSGASQDGPPISSSNGDIIRSGVLRKLKTSRKKFFVIRAETKDSLARLEYYDSERKFHSGVPPKRCIPLKACFDINRKHDTKHKHVIALYTKHDCFSIIFENEEKLKEWLNDLLVLQRGEEIQEGEILKSKFEFVYDVLLAERGLGYGRNGKYILCLTEDAITLVKRNEPIPTFIDLPLHSVRSCGNLQMYFYLEIGRASNIGAGELWFEVADNTIAVNLSVEVKRRFGLGLPEDEEKEKDIEKEKDKDKESTKGADNTMDIQPKSRTRSSSATESSKPIIKRFSTFSFKTSLGNASQDNNPSENAGTPTAPNATGAGSGWPGGVNHQRTQSLPIATPAATATSAAPLPDNAIVTNNATSLTNHNQHNAKKFIQLPGKSRYRQRCDSMPTRPRPRTSSEGNNPFPWLKANLFSYKWNHFRECAHSPPATSPISPSSESTGSSHSLQDDPDNVHEMDISIKNLHPITPDQIIAEEECTEPSGEHRTTYIPMTAQTNNFTENYMDMEPGMWNSPCTSVSNNGMPNLSSSSVSTSSVTSAAASSDIRFSDFPLDKVLSYVADENEVRPCRAHSVGSRPTLPATNNADCSSRARAFSVGSKKLPIRYLHNHIPSRGAKSCSAPVLHPDSVSFSSRNSINNPMDDLMEMDFSSPGTGRSRTSTNASSSSEPRSGSHKYPRLFQFLDMFKKGTADTSVESNKSGIATALFQTKNATVANADVKEPSQNNTEDSVDSSRNLTNDNNENNNSGVTHSEILQSSSEFSPYLDMSGSNRTNTNVTTTTTNTTNTNTTNERVCNDYTRINPVNTIDNVRNRVENVETSGLSPASSIERLPTMLPENKIPINKNTTAQEIIVESHSDYVDMNQRGRTNSNSASHENRNFPSSRNDNYLDMSGRIDCTRDFSTSNTSTSPNLDTAMFDYVENMPFEHSSTAQDISNYTRMTPIDINIDPDALHQKPISLDYNSASDHGDYRLMSNVRDVSTPKPKLPPKSKPISIQNTSNNKTANNFSPLRLSNLLGCNSPSNKTFSNIDMFNNSYLSFPRQKSSRKLSDIEKSKSGSKSVATTPSTSKTFPINLNTSSPSLNDESTSSNVSKIPSSSKKQNITDSGYTVMDFATKKFSPLEATTMEDSNSSYVNYSPPDINTLKRLNTDTSNMMSASKNKDFGDYAIMKPGVLPNRSTTLPKSKGSSNQGSTSPLATHFSSIVLGEGQQSSLFMPIKENERDDYFYTPKLADQVPDKLRRDEVFQEAKMEVRNEGLKSESSSGSASPLAKISRPNSSNSDIMKSFQRVESDKLMRPSSGCSGQMSTLASGISSDPSHTDQSTTGFDHQIIRLHYASLDLSTDTDDRKSPRTLKNASSEANLVQSGGNTFVYADIDFVKSEELNKNGGNSRFPPP